MMRRRRRGGSSARWLGIAPCSPRPNGDQELLIALHLFRSVGGIRPLPLMEDVDLVRRLGCERLVALDAVAVTSAERHRRDGYVRRSARNDLLLGLGFAGVPPRLLTRLY